MTTPADDTAVEEAFEAYLAGRVAPAPGERLAFFADAVRASATEPGRPSAALADLLATGLLTDQSSPSARTARPAPRGRRRRIRMFLPALLTKLAAAGLVAKAATGAGVVVVALSTAGFVGALPHPVQHTFATVVDSVTPLTAPDPDTATDDGTATGGTTTGAGDTSGTNTTGTNTTGTDDSATDGSATEHSGTADSGTVPSKPTPFGRTVSGMAHDDSDGKRGVDGAAVSSMAHARNEGRRSSADEASPSPTKPAEQTSNDDSSTESGDDSGSHGGSGRGSDH